MDILEFKDLVILTLDRNIRYDGIDRGRMINPSYLLDYYEMYHIDIRPKEVSVYVTDDDCIQITYVSQGSEDFSAMASMIRSALKSIPKEYKITMKVGSRDMELTKFRTYHINKK